MYLTGQMQRAVNAYFKDSKRRRTVHQVAVTFGVNASKLREAIYQQRSIENA